MRNEIGAVFAALLLIASLCASSAELFEPKGELVTDDKGFAFSFQHGITVFGEVFDTDKKRYVNRRTGRISLDTAIHNPDFLPNRVRPHQMLQPSEIFAEIDASVTGLWQRRLDEEQLVKIRDMIHANFWSSQMFAPVGGYLFTWEQQRRESMPTQTNTFQAAVIYNESSTYAVYNYNTMAFLDTIIGGKTMAGFSKKNSYESVFLPFTGASAGELPTVSGVSNRTLGRFIYRIDSWPPRRGGCLTKDPTSPADRVLSTTVSQDSVLGGDLAIVSGRCPEPDARGSCFVTMGGRRIGESDTLNCTNCSNVFLACRVPPSYREGSATFSLQMNTQENAYSTDFTFVSPDEPRGITLTGEYENWMKLSQGLRITYNPAGLRGNLMLRVIGYSESGLSQINAANSPMQILLEVAASAEGQMDLSSLSCPTSKTECDTHHLGFLEIVDSSTPQISIRSRIIPLGWFVNKYYQDKQQPTWYREKCKLVSSTDEQTQKVRLQLQKLACPSTLAQARADASRFLRLSYCPQLPGGCASATPKQECFVSRPESNVDIQGTPAAACCYDEAKGHMLYQELIGSGSDAWSQHGSQSMRSHPDGQPHSATLLPGQVSFMSHWYWDTLRFLYCCRWSNAGDCPFYFMHERPTPKNSNYAAGRGSATVGDPHMTSFSGRSFLFNGFGEFWLLRTDNFQVQGRYINLRDPIVTSATFLTVLSVRVGTGPAFEVSILPTGSNPRFRAQRRLVESETPTDIRLTTEYPFTEGGVTIKLNSASNLVIQLYSNSQSIGIDLYAADGFEFMNAFISVSDKMKGLTQGLLGRWTDDPAGEFVDIDGNVAEYRTNASEFHDAFCMKNTLKNYTESLFNYATTRSNGFLVINRDQRNAYRPVFTADGINPHGEETAVCQSDKNCVFDLRVTQNVNIARLTADHDAKFAVLQAASNSSVGFCDKPSVRGVRIAADAVLSEGASFTLACGLALKSSRSEETIRCTRQSDGTLKWQPDPASSGFECHLDATDPPVASDANVGLIVGITVPVAVLLIVAVIVIVIVMRRRSNSAAHGRGGSGRPKQQPHQQRQPQQQQQQQPHGSQMTIVSADSDRGFDNQGHANRRTAPPPAAAAVGGSGAGGAASETQAGGPQDDSLRRSYMQAQMEPLDADEFNPDQYADLQKPQVSKSEVV